MKIGVRVSELMSLRGENRIIRFPQDARDMYQVQIYRHLHSPGKNGQQVLLKSWYAYGKDTTLDSTVCYVSQAVYDLLEIDQAGEMEINLIQEISLGCDPEFFIVDSSNNEIVFASAVFNAKYADVGYDGMMVELRPMPDFHESGVCGKLWGLFQKARQRVNEYCQAVGVNPETYRFIGTSYLPLVKGEGFAAGFHLHYGMPFQLLGNVGWDHPKKKIARQITKVLDYYVGIPSIITEDCNEVKRRSNPWSEYGKPGAFRMDNRTLEYRTPGGAMLRHPILTEGLLGLGALVMEDVITKVSAWTNSFSTIDQVVNADIRDCYPNIPKDPKEIFGAICTADNVQAKKRLEKIANDLPSMMGFEKRKRSVEALLNCLEKDIQFDRDIELNWRSYYEEQPKSVGIF